MLWIEIFSRTLHDEVEVEVGGQEAALEGKQRRWVSVHQSRYRRGYFCLHGVSEKPALRFRCFWQEVFGSQVEINICKNFCWQRVRKKVQQVLRSLQHLRTTQTVLDSQQFEKLQIKHITSGCGKNPADSVSCLFHPPSSYKWQQLIFLKDGLLSGAILQTLSQSNF